VRVIFVDSGYLKNKQTGFKLFVLAHSVKIVVLQKNMAILNIFSFAVNQR